MNAVSISILVGFFGDLVLQLLTKYFHMGGPTGWGLLPYFEKHGTNEAAFTAAGMMGLFYVFYLSILGLPLRLDYLAVYGIVLDFIFRKLQLFSSLNGYYAHLNYFWSAVWGAIPMILPLIALRFVK